MTNLLRTASIFLLTCFALNGQLTTTTLLGTVTDASGSAVADAKVTATNTGTNLARTVTTSAEGEYRIEFLPVGGYELDVISAGFKKHRQTGIVLEISEVARVNVKLDVGAVSDTVSVAGSAPLVNTENASLGRTVNNAEITELPIVNRNVYTLLTLTPGVESSANSIVLGYPEQRTMINGGVDSGVGSVNYYLDGGSNMTGLRNTGNVAPSPDAVQEFRVITNSYSAEFGRFAGGVVDIVTKSGTNQLHGSLFEFFRNNDLNANVWGSATTLPLHRNQYGGTVGGPLRKSKTFAFGSYSGLRQITSTFMNTAVVPTALERAGDFSQSKTAPIDPVTGKAFPGSLIPASRLDKTALNILNKFIPLPNSPGNVWQGSVPSPYNTGEYLVKLDHTLTSNQQLAFSYFTTSGLNKLQPSGNLPWSVQQFTWRQHNANASDTWTINSSTVNQFWLTYTRNFGGRVNLPQTSLGDLGSTYGIQGTPSLPQITVSGYFTLGEAIAGPIAGTNYYSVRDMLSYTRGKHTLKMGGEQSLNKDVQQTLLNNYGVFAFTTLSTFLLGLPTTMNQDAPVTALDNSWTTGLFLQDDFRVLSNLTINLGLRWDLQTPPTDQHNRESTFIAGRQSTVIPSAPLGMLFVGDAGVTRGVIPARKHNFSPRLGMAWDPFGDGKTSFRAAGGLFYGSVSGNEWNTMSNYQPFAVRQQFNNIQSLSNVYGLFPGGVSPFPYSYDPKNPKFLPSGTIAGVSPDYVWPYTIQLNSSIQRQITKDFSITVAYVGSMSRHLPFSQDINYPVYNTTATTANVNNRRLIDPGALGILYSIKSIMNASYNGLQLSGEKRMGRHLGVKGFYTYSKSLTGAALQGSTTQGGAEDMNNLSLDKGRSDFDRRHNFVTSFIWQIDYFDKSNAILRSLLNGWTASAIVTLRSGQPFNVTTGKDNNLDGTTNDRPNLIGDPRLDPSRPRSATTAMWFNTAAFAQPANGTDGNSPRNLLDGPGLHNIDIGFFRNFPIRERMRLQARAELSNALNLVNLSNPTANIGSSLDGQIRSAGDMRQVQLGLRLIF